MFARFSLGLALALVLTVCSTPRAAERLKDRDGNPLPDGAVARLGTLSFRLATSDQAHGSMALSHDGKRIAVFETGKVHVWEVETGKTLRQFDYPFHPGYVEPVAISADGKRVIAFNANSGVQAWDVETGEVLFTHEEVGRSRASMGIGFLADGTAVYSRNFSTEDGNFVALHDAKTKKELTQFKGELGHSFALDINPDGKTLTGGMFDRENDCVHVRIYDAKTFELKKGIDDVAKGDGCNVAGSCPDGSTLLIVTTGGDITFWSVAEGKMLSKLEEKPLDIDHPVPATLSWDGKIAAVSGWEDGTVRLFDTATGKLVKKLDGAGKGGYLIMSKDGKRLAHRGTHAVQIWDVASGKEMHRDLPSHRSVPTAVAYSPDGQQLASAGGGEIVLWDLANGKALARWDALQGKKSATVDRLRFSADGKHLVASGTGLATLWDVPTRKLVHKWQGDETHFAAFHPDAKKLYVATPDGKMERWDIATRKALESNNEVLDDTHELLVTSGGERVILSGIDGLAFYDPKTLREVASIPREEGSWYACPTPDATGRRVGVVRTSDLAWTVLEPEGSPPRTGEALHGIGRELQGHASNRRLFAAFLGIDPRAETGGALVLLDRATGKVRHRLNLPFTEVRGMAFAWPPATVTPRS
jgi:WD40 repeat protein